MKEILGRPFAAVVGERLRAIREERGLRQDDIAHGARGVGFRWTRAAVAKLEAGQRRLSATEFLFLAHMINVVLPNAPQDRPKTVIELADLLPEDGWVIVNKENRIRAHALRMFLRGQLGDVLITDLDIPEIRHEEARRTQPVVQMHRALAKPEPIKRAVWPDAPEVDVFKARREAAGEAEQKAARRLGVPPFAIALEARRRWRCSLSAERDRRVTAEARETDDRRTLQAVRGHVTRSLLAELQNLPSQLATILAAPSRKRRSGTRRRHR
jgi:transcriptional regulator with XRE-family HTH domain